MRIPFPSTGLIIPRLLVPLLGICFISSLAIVLEVYSFQVSTTKDFLSFDGTKSVPVSDFSQLRKLLKVCIRKYLPNKTPAEIDHWEINRRFKSVSQRNQLVLPLAEHCRSTYNTTVV